MASAPSKEGGLQTLTGLSSKSSNAGNGNISLRKLLMALLAISLGTIIECELILTAVALAWQLRFSTLLTATSRSLPDTLHCCCRV